MRWVLGIVGVVFCGVVLDLIYPNGKTNILIKSIFGIILIMVILKPIFNFDFNFDNNFISDDLQESIKSSKDNLIIKQICNEMFELGISEVNVELDSKIDKNVYEIENVYIDMTNAVLLKNFENINIYENINNILMKNLNIDKEKILIFG